MSLSKGDEMKQKLTDWQLVVVAGVGILGIVAIELYALSQGINGVLLGGTISVIALIIGGLGGFKIGRR